MKRLVGYILAAVMICALTAGCSGSAEMNKGEEANDKAAGLPLKIGDYIQLGKYYDVPILWRCVDIDENGPLMLSNKLLCRKPFDIYQGNRTGSHVRRDSENVYLDYSDESNYWGDSNIRCWLNSAAPAGEVEWLCGNPPTQSKRDVNGYADEKGFLAEGNFTETERHAIQEVTQKSLLDPKDAEFAVGGSAAAWEELEIYGSSSIKNFNENQYDEVCYEYITDRIFLMDIKQLWNASQNMNVLGEDYFKPTLTQEAIDNDTEEQERIHQNLYDNQNTLIPLSTNIPYNYYLRTPYGHGRIAGQDLVYHSGDQTMCVSVQSSGFGYAINATFNAYPYKNYGIRPAFYLDESNAEILSGSGTEKDPYVVDGKKKHEIRVYLNGAEVLFDQPPVTEADRTLVPIRAIAEAMGADVGWEEESRTAEIRFGVQTVRFQIDNPVMKRNGEEVWLEAPPRQIGDRTLVPLRALAEGFGATVDWDEGTKTVSISWQ